MTRHSQRPQRDNTDLDAFFAEADDILENWRGGTDSNEWHADGSHQTSIHGDYYGQDYPESDDQEPDDEAAEFMAAREAERRRTNPRNGGGLFRPPLSHVDDVGNYPSSYHPLVMRIWLTDVWFAGWLGVIGPMEAENIRNGFPSCTSLRDLNALLTYVTRYDHQELVQRVDQRWIHAMTLAEQYGNNTRAVMFPSGQVYTPGDPAPWPTWEECLLPVPPDHGEEYVRQVYLHSWLMLHPQLPVSVPVAGAAEEMVRQIIETQFSGHRLVTGLHGSRFAYYRDEEQAVTRFSLRCPARNDDNDLVWLTAEAAISDQLAHRARQIEHYGLPLMRGDMDRMDPFVSRYHDLTAAMETLRGAYQPLVEQVTGAALELEAFGTALNDAEAGEVVAVELNNPTPGGTDE